MGSPCLLNFLCYQSPVHSGNAERNELGNLPTSSSVLELLRICIHFKIERRGTLLTLGGIDLVGLILLFFGVSESYGPICIDILSVKMLHIIKAMFIHLWHQPHRFYS